MKIIGFSGKKQSGKDSACNYLIGKLSKQHGLIDNFEFKTDTGEIFVDKDITQPVALKFSFASALKELVIQILGLDPALVYGGENERNQLTRYMWEEMPMFSGLELEQALQDGGPVIKRGHMTVREVLEVVGTDIFRKMYYNVWVDTLFRTLNEFPVPLAYAFISDVRFPNEGDKIKEFGGTVVRLTRAPHEDAHLSENAMENYKFDYVIDNANMDILDKNKELDKFMESL